MIIAIDGPAAAGKGTLAKRLGAHFGLAVLDTGLLYRAVGLKTVRLGVDPNDADAAGAEFPGDGGGGLGVVGIGAPAHRLQAHGAIEKARIQDRQAEVGGQPLRQRSLAGGGRAVDGDDHGAPATGRAVTGRPRR